MSKKLTAKQMHARYEALEEAAQHLQMTWTDKNIEYVEGLIMSDWLRSESRKWLARAMAADEAQKPKQSV